MDPQTVAILSTIANVVSIQVYCVAIGINSIIIIACIIFILNWVSTHNA